MDAPFTAAFQTVPEGFIAWVDELPGANSQGATREETRENLVEAIVLVLEANRLLEAGGQSPSNCSKEARVGRDRSSRRPQTRQVRGIRGRVDDP